MEIRTYKLNKGDIFTIDINTYINNYDSLKKITHIMTEDEIIKYLGPRFQQPYNCITLYVDIEFNNNIC